MRRQGRKRGGWMAKRAAADENMGAEAAELPIAATKSYLCTAAPDARLHCTALQDGADPDDQGKDGVAEGGK